jgi:6-phosphogluconolactonase
MVDADPLAGWKPGPAMSTFVFAGTYTQKSKTEHRSEGIFAYRFHSTSGELTLSAASHAGLNPSFVRMHPNKRFLYTVNELGDGQASSLAVDVSTGALTLLNSQPTRGAHPCYVSIDPAGKFMLVSNYSSGSLAVFPIEADGRLAPMSGFVEHGGTGPDPRRQERTHAHSIGFDLSGKHVLAADLGIDRVFVYRLNAGSGELVLGDLWGAAMRPGAGPRHFTCHPNGKIIYVANEVDSTVTVCSWNDAIGSLAPIQNLTTLPDGFAGDNTVADIHLDPASRTLYVSNRGDNSLAVFRVKPDGLLERVGIVSCGGNWPRNFAIDPSGQWLLCANQFSNDIVVFRLHPESGMPEASGVAVSVTAPVSLEFAEF